MYSATDLLRRLPGLALAVALLSASCSDPNLQQARDLCDRADQAVAEGQYAPAIAMLDSLDREYRSYTEVRRQGMVVRERAIEGMTLDSLTACDERLALATLAADSLSRLMRFVDGSDGLEGYWVAASDRTDGLLNANTVQGRTDPKGYFRLVANQNASRGLRAVRFLAPGVDVTVGPVSSSRVVTVEGAEIVSFTQEEAAEAMTALCSLNPKELKCEFIDRNGCVKCSLDAKKTAALLTAWRYSVARQELARTTARREKLERRLAQARNHLANVIQ